MLPIFKRLELAFFGEEVRPDEPKKILPGSLGSGLTFRGVMGLTSEIKANRQFVRILGKFLLFSGFVVLLPLTSYGSLFIFIFISENPWSFLNLEQ